MQDYPVSFLRLHGDWMGVFRVTHSGSSFLPSPPLFFLFFFAFYICSSMSCWKECFESRNKMCLVFRYSENPLSFCKDLELICTPEFLTSVTWSLPCPQNAPLHTSPNIFTCTTKGFVSGDSTVRNMKQNQSCWVAQAAKSSLGGSFEHFMLVPQQKQLTFSFHFFPTTLFVLVQLYQREVRGWNKSRELSL